HSHSYCKKLLRSRLTKTIEAPPGDLTASKLPGEVLQIRVSHLMASCTECRISEPDDIGCFGLSCRLDMLIGFAM
ncbi:hypothetical protein, partial [Yaniella flava]|uniref:hypothetical protein n=1 Tax=Yaniella flava TaxID=287930 RepID=UPI0031D04E7E